MEIYRKRPDAKAFEVEWALERAGSKSGNRGFLAAMNAIEMADLAGQL